MMEDISLVEDRALACKDIYYREYAAWRIAGTILFAHKINLGLGGYVRDGKMHIAQMQDVALHLMHSPIPASVCMNFEAVFILQVRGEVCLPTNPWEFSDTCDLWVSRDHRCIQDGMNWRDFDVHALCLIAVGQTREKGIRTNHFLPRFEGFGTFDEFCPFKYELHRCGILDESKLDINERYRR